MTNPASVAHGPALVGVLLNVLLYGVMCMQTLTYYTNCTPKEKIWIRCFVASLFIADTVNCVFDICWIYNILIDHFADLSALEKANWVFATDPAMVGIIASAVQCFFAWRIHVLICKWWITTFVVLTALGSATCGLATAVEIHRVPEFTLFREFQVVVIVWLICAALCDITITLALTSYLNKHRTGFSQTDDIVDRVIRLTVQNGLITSVWAIVDLISYLATPSGLHLVFNFPLCKLYTNSLMSSLNSRKGWYNTRTSDGLDHISFRRTGTLAPTRDVMPAIDLDGPLRSRPEIFVSVERHELHDTGLDSSKPRPNWGLSGSDTAVSLEDGTAPQEIQLPGNRSRATV